MSTALDTLDEMTREALVAALWVGVDWDTLDESGNPAELDAAHDTHDVSDEARAAIRADLLAFCNTHRDDVLAYLATDDYRSPYGYSRAALFAHDYMLTRNHHGAGFWDRGLGDLGERLTVAAHADGEWDLYVGDDGRLYA